MAANPAPRLCDTAAYPRRAERIVVVVVLVVLVIVELHVVLQAFAAAVLVAMVVAVTVLVAEERLRKVKEEEERVDNDEALPAAPILLALAIISGKEKHIIGLLLQLVLGDGSCE